MFSCYKSGLILNTIGTHNRVKHRNKQTDLDFQPCLTRMWFRSSPCNYLDKSLCVASRLVFKRSLTVTLHLRYRISSHWKKTCFQNAPPRPGCRARSRDVSALARAASRSRAATLLWRAEIKRSSRRPMRAQRVNASNALLSNPALWKDPLDLSRVFSPPRLFLETWMAGPVERKDITARGRNDAKIWIKRRKASAADRFVSYRLVRRYGDTESTVIASCAQEKVCVGFFTLNVRRERVNAEWARARDRKSERTHARTRSVSRRACAVFGGSHDKDIRS